MSIWNSVLVELLPVAVSAIKDLIKSSVVPKLKRKMYERLDYFCTDIIEELAALKEKAENTENDIKKIAHLEGLKLGSATIRAIGEKLIKAADVLDS